MCVCVCAYVCVWRRGGGDWRDGTIAKEFNHVKEINSPGDWQQYCEDLARLRLFSGFVPRKWGGIGRQQKEIGITGDGG